MGINGLLPALKPIARAVHVSKYKGQRVAVDGYSWLHKGAYCCARELVEGAWTDKYVTYFMSRVQTLRAHGVEPLIVFDGGRLPIKGEEEQARHRARAEAREKAAAHLAAGNVAAAVECYQRCVDVTPAMAKQVIEELKVARVAFLVAPYEADAQMAYLARSGDVQLVVTEDSDLLAYGCPRVLYKLDRAGAGEELSLTDLPHCPGLPLAGFTSDQFLQLCVLAGCDFLAQLPGIGLKKAHGCLRKYRSFTKVVKMLRFNGTRVPAEYEARFQLALWAFRHARVYCPAQKGLVHLAPLPGGGIGAADVDVPQALAQLEQQQQLLRLDFLGPSLSNDVARSIAEGELDPMTHKPWDLAALYAGCPNPPPHIAAQLAALLPPPRPEPQLSQGGAAASGRPRVGLSRKHARQGSGSQLPGSGVGKLAAGGGGGSGGDRRRRASLGIAKYFQAPTAAAAAATGAGSSDAGTAAGMGAAAGAALSLQQSISNAVQALGQRLQQRHAQQQADKQQLLDQLRQQQQQHQQPRRDAEVLDLTGADAQAEQGAAAAAVGSDGLAEVADQAAGGGCWPPAKRRRVFAAPFASGAQGAGAATAATADSDGTRGGSLEFEGSLPDSLGTPGGGLASLGRCSLTGPGEGGSELGLEASLPGSSSQGGLGLGSAAGQDGPLPARAKGVAVSALSALFGQPMQQQLTQPTQEQQLPGRSNFFRPSTAGVGSSPLSSPLGQAGGLGSAWGTGLSSCESPGLQHAGQPGSLSSGSLGLGGFEAAAGAGGTSGLSSDLALADSQAPAGAGSASSSGSSDCLRRLQRSLRVGLGGALQQHDLSSASGFEPVDAPAGRAPRRHSRFRAQLLHSSATAAADEDGSSQEQHPAGLAFVTAAGEGGSHPAQWQQLAKADTEAEEQQAAPPSLQRRQAAAPAAPEQPASPGSGSGGSASNDENDAAAAGADDYHSIAHVRGYARLAAKVVHKLVQPPPPPQQQPLAPQPGLLNTQPPPPPEQQAEPPMAPAAALLLGRPRFGLSRRSSGAARPRPRSGGKAPQHKTLASALAGLHYDASLFVPVHTRDGDGDGEAGASDEAGQGLAGRPRAAAARAGGLASQPFKAPFRLAPAASSGSASQGSQPQDAGGLGAFSSFACGAAGSGTGGGSRKPGGRFSWR